MQLCIASGADPGFGNGGPRFVAKRAMSEASYERSELRPKRVTTEASYDRSEYKSAAGRGGGGGRCKPPDIFF